VWEIIEAAGWPIWPLIATSVYGFAIILERAWALRVSKIMPRHLIDTVHLMLRQGVMKKENLDELRGSSPFGEIIYTALKNKDASLEVLKDSIEESAGLVAHRLEVNINALGTISTVAPLLGLFGTIVGMVELFSSFTSSGHDVAIFARGISVALYNTAGGIVVAVPAMIAFRYYRSKVENFMNEMQLQTIAIIETARGERE
jgi:biopolymer transport protein ExbB